jgi:hypothetical protein
MSESQTKMMMQRIEATPEWSNLWSARAVVLQHESDLADQKIPLAIEMQEYFLERLGVETDGVNWLSIAKELLRRAKDVQTSADVGGLPDVSRE